MTLSEMISSIRRQLVDDAGVDPYCTDADIIEYLNEGYNIFCRSTKIIRDSLTASVCTLTVAAGSQHIALSQLIIDIERARGSWSTTNLGRKTVAQLDEDNASWIGSAGTPTKYTLEYSSNYMSLNRAASVAGTITLTVTRLPLVSMVNAADVPAFSPAYHWMLLDYALYRAFSKKDSEINNPQKAMLHKSLFMGDNEASPGGHILRVITEIDPLPEQRTARYF
jgi:hypothetical protein